MTIYILNCTWTILFNPNNNMNSHPLTKANHLTRMQPSFSMLDSRVKQVELAHLVIGSQFNDPSAKRMENATCIGHGPRLIYYPLDDTHFLSQIPFDAQSFILRHRVLISHCPFRICCIGHRWQHGSLHGKNCIVLQRVLCSQAASLTPLLTVQEVCPQNGSPL
jgi:hypothetical protein